MFDGNDWLGRLPLWAQVVFSVVGFALAIMAAGFADAAR